MCVFFSIEIEQLISKPPKDSIKCFYVLFNYFNFLDHFVQILNKIDKAANQLCPFLAAGVVVSTLYWSAASYGAITVMQVFKIIAIKIIFIVFKIQFFR